MRAFLLLASAALLALGCGGPKVVKVSGRVTLDGKPLAGAHVNFQPIGEGTVTPGPGSHGKTNANGEYTLSYVGGGEGVVVGKHRVEISSVTGQDLHPEDDRQRAAADRVPARYNTESELTFTVPPGGTTEANFQLLSK